MINTDENALICDFAETYHILDYRSLPASRAAILAAGLRDDSRVKMKLVNVKCPVETQLLALALDRLSMLLWARTEDGAKNRNRPPSVYSQLMGYADDSCKRDDLLAFDSGTDFEKARQRIIRGKTDGN